MSDLRWTRATSGVAVRAQARAARHARGDAAIAARQVQRRRWAALLGVWLVVSGLGAAAITMLVGFGWIVFTFFGVVVAVSCLPLFAPTLARPAWLLERQVRAGDDVDLAVTHLSPRLRRLAQETRVLRFALEAAAPDEGAVDDWVWAWVSAVRGLEPEDKAVVEDLGVTHHDVARVLLGTAMATEDPAPPVALDAHTLTALQRRAELLAEHLEAFEAALLRHDADPYR